MPSIAQIGDFMMVSTPCGSPLIRLALHPASKAAATVAHHGAASQAGFATPILRAGVALGRRISHGICTSIGTFWLLRFRPAQ
jgi:cytochrome c biogenesis protein CcdA